MKIPFQPDRNVQRQSLWNFFRVLEGSGGTFRLLFTFKQFAKGGYMALVVCSIKTTSVHIDNQVIVVNVQWESVCLQEVTVAEHHHLYF